MTHSEHTSKRKVLISGASIAGPALAYWLNRYGFEVTVVERASAPRSGGYPIDLRGTAVDVARRMGILPRLQEAHVGIRRLTFLNEDGSEAVSLPADTATGSTGVSHLELRRGDLTDALYATVRDDVEFVFNDSIDTLEQHDHGVDVTFRSGNSRSFDFVIGADGIHSRTRALVFGPEEQFLRYLGYAFAGFTMPNTFGLYKEGVSWNTPGKAAVIYAVERDDEVDAFLTFTSPEPPSEVFHDVVAQRELVAKIFAGAGWEVPRMLDAVNQADDLFFDIVAQIHMPRWSSGRVALVGDAAFAPSFLTGQGTSLALVGAYMLAWSLVTHGHTDGFASYERGLRQFVTLNQNLVGDGTATLFPKTAEELAQRNARLRQLRNAPQTEPEPAYTALTVPDFP